MVSIIFLFFHQNLFFIVTQKNEYEWLLFPCRYSTKRKKLILSWKSRWHPSSNTWFFLCVFLYLFRIFSQNFSYFVFVPVVVDFSLFFWVIHWCNKELSCRASVLRDVSDWILPAFSKFGQHQLLRRISRWINNLVPRVLSYSAPVVTGAE